MKEEKNKIFISLIQKEKEIKDSIKIMGKEISEINKRIEKKEEYFNKLSNIYSEINNIN